MMDGVVKIIKKNRFFFFFLWKMITFAKYCQVNHEMRVNNLGLWPFS